MFYELLNFSDQFSDTIKCSAAVGSFRNEIKPVFHLIEPQSISGDIVNLVAGVGRQPPLYLSVLVGAIVIDH